MKNRGLHIIPFLFCLLLAGCYTNRYIPEGSHILDETVQTIVMADSSAATPEVSDAIKRSNNYYAQRPNPKFLGIKSMPVGVWLYSIARPTDSTFWGNYWRRLGQAPVVYDENKARRTARQLQGLLESKGCFKSTCTFDTIAIDGRKISIGFHLTATQRYLIDEVAYHTDDPAVRQLLEQWSPDALLKAGVFYDQENLASERSRLVNNLREAGYYHAAADNISFLVDTTYSPSKLSIDVNVDSRNLHVYHINNIYIYPNSTAGLHTGQSTFDTIIHNYAGINRTFDYQFVHDKPLTIKPLTISRSMMLFPGMIYRPSYINNTYNSLLNLRNFKYINIEFTESPSSSDSLPLVDAHVRLINTTQQKLSLSLELTNASPIGAADSSSNFFSSGNLGIETSIEYQHKNLFGGAELLKVKSSLLLELPKISLRSGSDSFYDNFSAFEINLDASLDVPAFLIPYASHIVWQRVRPHTLFSAGGSYQYRYWFERILANTSFGYNWTRRTALRTTQHQLLPIELTFVRILNLDNDFAARIGSISDLRMKYQYSSHFIMDARYDFSFSNQQFNTRRNFTHFHVSLESAGNLLSAASSLFDAHADTNDIRQIFGVPFAQYARINAEFIRYTYIGQRSSFVTRLLLGTGLPYGNSLSMPYEKSFFGGGPTTMRAWQLRRLGPGSFVPSSNSLERVGDLQLVLNLEGRFPIASIFEGAIFSDLGNVWLLNPSSEYPGGELRWNDLLHQIAVGVGLGLRVNVSIATLRLDFAIPLYDPGFDSDLQWRPPHWDFNQIVTNFGINYPF